VYDDWTWDLRGAVKDIVRPGETISSTNFERRPGGKGANQAVAIAKALGTSGKVDLECCVGEDGRWLLRELEKMGVYAGGVAVVKVSFPFLISRDGRASTPDRFTLLGSS
jgi:sugar/nucleoside kinase (ribokinase family)